MANRNDAGSHGLTRRDVLKGSSLTLGGFAFAPLLSLVGGRTQASDSCPDRDCSADCDEGPSCRWDKPIRARRYSYFEHLPRFYPFSSETRTQIQPLGEDEMRITFMGSSIPPNLRQSQQMMSIFVEIGWDPVTQTPIDQFVFDCGSGVCTNYGNMNVGFGRMNKIFLTHLHGDHMSDLTHIYCFGPSADRKSPLFIWGPGPSGVESPPGSGIYYEDGTSEFCRHLRAACRWHTESFSFQTTRYTDYVSPTKDSWGLPQDPIPVGDGNPDHDDPVDDAYAMIPIELKVKDYDPANNIAYENNGVKITYFPVIHTRVGSLGYKLEWTRNGKTLTMIYSGDTKPEQYSVEQASNNGSGVDVFIHEMGLPAQVWAMKNTNASEPLEFESRTVQTMLTVQNSSHSPQGAFGYLLSRMDPLPRLTVATHFPASDDTVSCALKSVRQHVNVAQGNDQPSRCAGSDGREVSCPPDAARITWSFDLMVISVTPDRIVERRGVVPEIGFVAAFQPPPGTVDANGDPIPYGYHAPKYGELDENGLPVGDPYAQIDTSTQYCGCNEDGSCNFREDGF
jgi:ribonuclease Z